MKKYFLLILAMLPMLSVGQEDPLDYVDFYSVNDLDFSVFDNPKYADYYNKIYSKEAFLEQHFKAWKPQEHTLSQQEWEEYFTYDILVNTTPCFLGNYREHTNEFIVDLKLNLPFDQKAFPHVVKYGLTLKDVDIRRLPTEEYCLKRVRNAGEGYPFDYMQYSTLPIASPLVVLSVSKDKQWYFIDSSNNHGWVKASDIAFVNPKQMEELKTMDFGAVVNENTVLEGKNGAIKLQIGTLLPMSFVNGDTVLLPYKTFETQELFFDEVPLYANDILPFPIAFDAHNVRHILAEMHNKKYSWGGIDGGRDCSSTLKDYLTPFGIWLPRNSYQQSEHGDMVVLPKNSSEKLSKIAEEGIPFLSSVYKKGHIMLYVGTDADNTPLIYQNVWGLKAFFKKDYDLSQVATKRQGYGIFGMHAFDEATSEVQTRFIIGKTVITKIEPSQKLQLLKNVRIDSFIDNIYLLTKF